MDTEPETKIVVRLVGGGQEAFFADAEQAYSMVETLMKRDAFRGNAYWRNGRRYLYSKDRPKGIPNEAVETVVISPNGFTAITFGA